MAKHCCICGQKVSMIDGTKMFGGSICLSCNARFGDLTSQSCDAIAGAIDYFSDILQHNTATQEAQIGITSSLLSAKEYLASAATVVPVTERKTIKVSSGSTKLVMTDVAFILSVGREERTIPFSQVISFQVKEPRNDYQSGTITIAVGGAPSSFVNLTGWLSVGNSNNAVAYFSFDQIDEAREMNRRFTLYHKAINAIPVQSTANDSAADAIKKYKELLDMGAITEEEYQAKKKSLLGL